jgi:streptogramin lyase
MSNKLFFGTILMALAAILFAWRPNHAQAQAPASQALAGQVSSPEEGPMEGVLVSAKKEGSTVTITVVSDAQGRYVFPRTRLQPGRYTLRIRAVGYDLNDPGPVEITAQKPARLDLKLRPTKDLAAQLTNTEWFLSWPGTTEQKLAFTECISCHTAERIARSHYTASDFEKVVERMRGWASGSTAPNPIKRTHLRPGTGLKPEDREFLSSINLSKVSAWEYPLKTLPRPKGRSTRVIYTEYDLPRPYSSPHDVVMAPNGIVWYCDFGYQYIGMLDPKTAKVVEYTVPTTKPGFDNGMNNLEIDRQGNVWVALFYQPGMAKFDPKTQKFQTWSMPKDLDSDSRRTVFFAPLNQDADGKVWLGGGMDKSFRMDLQSGQWEVMDESRDVPNDSPIRKRPHGIYGILSDSKNNLYELDMLSEYIVKVDAKSRKATYYQTPTMKSGPRRGHFDSKDRLWFAEHYGNKIAMFDSNTEQFQEWAVPTPLSNPYDAVLDKNQEVWMGGMASDRIVRLNPKTGEMTEYLLPRSTNVRRVDVDNATTPVTFWVGNNDSGSIVKLEPLD